MSAQINLYNPALRVKREWISATNLILGLIVVLCGVGLAYVYFEIEVGRLSAEGRAVEAELSSRQEEFARLTEELARIRRSEHIEQTAALRERQLRARQDVVAALGAGELGVSNGFSQVLKALARQTVQGLWLTRVEVSAGGVQIGLTGRALNAALLPQYVQKLNAESALAGRGFAALEIRTPEQAPGETAAAGSPGAAYVEFSLSATGVAPAVDAGPAGAAAR